MKFLTARKITKNCLSIHPNWNHSSILFFTQNGLVLFMISKFLAQINGDGIIFLIINCPKAMSSQAEISEINLCLVKMDHSEWFPEKSEVFNFSKGCTRTRCSCNSTAQKCYFAINTTGSDRTNSATRSGASGHVHRNS